MANPTLTTRLPIDGDVIAYYGFDEANETDPALDEGPLDLPLTVLNAVSVVPARLGNGRQFDGATTQASPSDSTDFRLGSMTAIVWVTLDSVQSVGSLRRTIIACDGPTAGSDDYTLYNLGVRNDGALIFEHQALDGATIRFVTAAAAVRVKRYYSIAIVREVDGAYCTVTLYVDNTVMSWASVTRNGVPIADPLAIPSPIAAGPSSTQTFKAGISERYGDDFWHGVIDELSLHKIPRLLNPYLRSAYFRLTLAMSFSRLTTLGNVRTIGTAEMGGGSRWWCYERDQSIYVIRENTLGLFGAEIQLTTGGTLWSGAPMPGGTEQPRLAYDSTSDVLLVAFLAAGRVYKLTATSEDSPSTQNMPYTADTPTIIKIRDAIDLHRGAVGSHMLEPGNPGVYEVGDGLAAPSAITFLHTPSFGIAIEGLSTYGYAVYRVMGGVETLLGTVTTPQTARLEAYQLYHFYLVGSRPYAAGYRARPLNSAGRPGKAVSSTIYDFWGIIVVYDPYEPYNLVLSHDGDFTHDHLAPGAGSCLIRDYEYITISRTPIKLSAAEAMSGAIGSGLSRSAAYVFTSRTPVKVSLYDPLAASAGASTRLTMQKTGGRIDQ